MLMFIARKQTPEDKAKRMLKINVNKSQLQQYVHGGKKLNP